MPLNDAPYHVSILLKDKKIGARHICGGSIVSRNVIMTAAHYTSASNKDKLAVRVGSRFKNSGGTLIHVAQIVNHPLYRSFNYDISLVKLAQNIILKSGQKEVVKIPPQNDPIVDQTLILVCGWGETKNVSQTNLVLSGVLLNIVNLKKCKSSDPFITNEMICARDIANGGKSSCRG